MQRLESLHRDLYHRTHTHVLREPKDVNTWLVIPYHPKLAPSAFMQAVRSVQQDFVDFDLKHYVQRLSWKRQFKNLREVCAGMI